MKRFTLHNLPNLKLPSAKCFIISAFTVLALPCTAQYQQQYQYPPGYYYPRQQPRNPQYPQQHQRQYQQPYYPARSTPTPAPRKPKAPPRDNSNDSPPTADISSLIGPFTTYTWKFTDTLAHLGKATGTTPNQILALNNLSLSQLRDEQILKIPEITSTSPENLDIKPAESDQMAREVWRGVRGKKRIALTYDAGGDRDYGELLLKNLQDHNVPATFFVAGEFATKHSDLLKKISDAGFPVHNHSWSHPDFTKISNDEIASELFKADDAISSVTGTATKPYWRPPFGERDDRVLTTAADEGYKSIYWTIDSLDSVGEPKDAAFVLDRVLSPSNAKANPDSYLDGAIILMHVGKKGTAEAVPDLAQRLRERGLTLVTVDEILKP